MIRRPSAIAVAALLLVGACSQDDDTIDAVVTTSTTIGVPVSNPPSNVDGGNDQLGGAGYKGQRPGSGPGGGVPAGVDIDAIQSCLTEAGLELPAPPTGDAAPAIDPAITDALDACGIALPAAPGAPTGG